MPGLRVGLQTRKEERERERKQKLSRVCPSRWERGHVLGCQGLPSRAVQEEMAEGALSPLSGPHG